MLVTVAEQTLTWTLQWFHERGKTESLWIAGVFWTRKYTSESTVVPPLDLQAHMLGFFLSVLSLFLDGNP